MRSASRDGGADAADAGIGVAEAGVLQLAAHSQRLHARRDVHDAQCRLLIFFFRLLFLFLHIPLSSDRSRGYLREPEFADGAQVRGRDAFAVVLHLEKSRAIAAEQFLFTALARQAGILGIAPESGESPVPP